MTEELWEPFPVEVFSNTYEISNTGRCRNKLTQNILKPYLASKYMMLSLSYKGKLYRYLVHRSVACAFVSSDDDTKNIVNHIDGDKMNNQASNLEWTTSSENAKHSIVVLNRKKTTKKIIRIDEEGNEVIYEGITLAASKNGIPRQYIRECARGVREQCRGFRWKYYDEAKHGVQSVDLTKMKEISEFPGYYINEYGKIYGISKRRFLTHNLSDGYPKIMLYKNAKPYCYYVHILVAKHFIPNPENKKVVNHIDNNKMNCHVSNLEWVSHRENTLKYYEYKRNSSVRKQDMKISAGSGEKSEVSEKSEETQDNPEPSS